MARRRPLACPHTISPLPSTSPPRITQPDWAPNHHQASLPSPLPCKSTSLTRPLYDIWMWMSMASCPILGVLEPNGRSCANAEHISRAAWFLCPCTSNVILVSSHPWQRSSLDTERIAPNSDTADSCHFTDAGGALLNPRLITLNVIITSSVSRSLC